MLIFLPHDIYGLAKLKENLIHEKLQKAFKFVSQSQPQKVEVSLPRFKLTQQFLLNEILAGKGATDMFSEYEADFSGITAGPERIHVSRVIHKAFVEVNEKGTGVVWLWRPLRDWWWIPSFVLITHFCLWFAIRSQMQFWSWAACWSHNQALR